MKNKFRFSILLVAILCLYSTLIFAQFSKNDAINLVTNTVLINDIGDVDVYASKNSINSDITLIDSETIVCPYIDNWVFFVNDEPWAGWYHNCRYIFVNSANGDYTIVTDDIYPKDQDIVYELISESTGNQPFDFGENTGEITVGLPPNDHYYAVIISVGDFQEYWNDVSLIYNTLIDIYGYKKDNIFVHYGPYGTSQFGDDLDDPNDPSDDLDYSAFGTEIHATFDELAGITTLNNDIPALGTDDQLAFFVVDAPVSDEIPGLTLWAFWDDWGGGPELNVEDPTEIADIVDDISCAQIIMAFSFNSAGGVIDEFAAYGGQAECNNRYIHACTNFGNKHLEEYITDGNYGEYFYYWAAAARGVYPETDYPWIPSDIEAGTFPFTTISGLESHPGDFDPDSDGDGYVQMEEAFYYADALDTWSDDGYYYNPWEPGEVEAPVDYDGIPFIEDVMTLAGYAGHIETEDIFEGSFVIGGHLIFDPVTPPYKFEFANTAELFMVNPQAKITILEGSHVKLHYEVKFAGNCIFNEVLVQGELTELGVGTEFKGIDNGQWRGLVYDDVSESNSNELTLAIFSDCLISGSTSNLVLNEVDFTTSGIHLSASNVSVSNCDFTNSYSDFTSNNTGDEYIDFYSNNFYGEGIIKPAIKLNSVPNFNMFDTYIDDHSGGIKIYHSGTGTVGHLIEYSWIINCSGSGITIYHSSVDLEGNVIKYNDYGIMVYDRSNVSLIGYEDAFYPGETQKISDNDSYEFYCSRSSFPHTFLWNAIIDEDNTEPMVYATGAEGPFDVSNNFWGNSFDPEEDFYPWQGFIYKPIWTLIYGSGEADQAKTLYFTSTSAEADNNYTLAQTGYYQIVSEYSESKYADAAMKRLYAIESYVNNDYSSLKTYYCSEPNIVNNTRLNKLADFLVNLCEIKLENYPTAIAWFENVIQNPESMEDSIFAIIDLGYTYFLMEQSGYKNAYSGTLTEHIPVTQKKYNEKRDFLLSLLPGDQLSKEMKESITTLKEGELLQNVPNPFKGSTQIWYKLEIESEIQLNIFSYTGQLVRTVNEGTKSKGNHYVNFDATGLKNGIYFYSIIINGRTTDSKKMTIMK